MVNEDLADVLFFLQELRALKAKYRPHRNGEKDRYKPAMGRDTNSGPLVDAKVQIFHACKFSRIVNC